MPVPENFIRMVAEITVGHLELVELIKTGSMEAHFPNFHDKLEINEPAHIIDITEAIKPLHGLITNVESRSIRGRGVLITVELANNDIVCIEDDFTLSTKEIPTEERLPH